MDCLLTERDGWKPWQQGLPSLLLLLHRHPGVATATYVNMFSVFQAQPGVWQVMTGTACPAALPPWTDAMLAFPCPCITVFCRKERSMNQKQCQRLQPAPNPLMKGSGRCEEGTGVHLSRLQKACPPSPTHLFSAQHFPTARCVHPASMNSCSRLVFRLQLYGRLSGRGLLASCCTLQIIVQPMLHGLHLTLPPLGPLSGLLSAEATSASCVLQALLPSSFKELKAPCALLCPHSCCWQPASWPCCPPLPWLPHAPTVTTRVVAA